jgi:hypothetical protein
MTVSSNQGLYTSPTHSASKRKAARSLYMPMAVFVSPMELGWSQISYRKVSQLNSEAKEVVRAYNFITTITEEA